VPNIKIESFLIRHGNRVGKASVEFTEFPLAGLQMVGFTICDEPQKGMYVMFPAAVNDKKGKDGERSRPYFFLRPTGLTPDALSNLENAILDEFEKVTAKKYANRPRIKSEEVAS
jgi:hypothetical protein